MACVRPVKTILAYLFLLACGEAAAAARLLFVLRWRARVVSVAKSSARLSELCLGDRGRGACYKHGWRGRGLRGAGARLGLTKLRSVVSYVKTASHGCLLRALLLSLGCFASLREDAMPNIMSSVMSH